MKKLSRQLFTRTKQKYFEKRPGTPDTPPSFPTFLYVKRIDLRPDEFPDTAEEGELSGWKWWIDPYELMDEISDKEEKVYVKSGIHPDLLPIEEYFWGEQDPSHIILLFCQCHKMGVYPPPWIMNQLYNRFKEYTYNNFNGIKPSRLGEYFGEPKNGNRSSYFRQLAFMEVMDMNFRAIETLRKCFNKSKDDAISLVAMRMEVLQNDTSFKVNKGEAAIEKAYKAWDRREKNYYRKHLDEKPLSREKKIEFLKSFPPDAFIGHPDLKSLVSK